MENAGLFQFGPGNGAGFESGFRDVIPFFSRRIGLSGGQIVPIFGGARVSGRAGPYTMGLLSLQTDEFEATPSTNFSVIRVRRDILSNSDIGGIFVNKHGNDGNWNRAFGTDLNLTFFQSLDITSFLAKTDNPAAGGEDTAGLVRVTWTDPFLTLQGGYLSVEDDFSPEVGFAPRRNIRKSTGFFAIRPRPG